MTIPLKIRVAGQSKTRGGWVVCVQGKPTLLAFTSKAEAVNAAVSVAKSLRIEVKPILRLRSL